MKLSARIAAPAAALVLAGLTATACAPQTSDTSSEGDKKTGTLRVWLFQEVGNKPKQKVVDAAVAAFEKSHEGAEVEVEYIPVDTRAQRIKAAISKEFAAWDEAKDTDPTAKQSVTVDGSVYGAPLFVGVRALYYRTDVLDELGIEPPKSQAELISTAKKIHKEKPDLYGLAVGGAYTYGAMPFIWAQGGELAEETGVTYRSAINSAKARKGIEAYTSLFGDDNCPAAKCAAMGGNATVTAFASGKAAMAIGGDFSHAAVEAGAVKGKYAVVPLPGVKEGSIAPAFAGGNNIGVLKSSSHRTLAVDLMKSLTGKKTQAEMFDAMGFLPTYTDVLESAAEKEPFVGPFVNTLGAGAKFVPASPAWGQIDASLVLPTMFQEIVSGRKDVAAASDDAAKKMDTAFAEAG